MQVILKSQRNSMLLKQVQLRAFGGHHDDTPREVHYRKADKTNYVQASDADLKAQLPQNPNWSEKLLRQMKGRWHPDRDDLLENDAPSKRHFTYWAAHSPLFHNSMFLRLT